ncbi:chloramphenicol acetyltransferase [Vagococcus coleopterorum]|uniref:Chloramphenicol acetyltransferase n=1 Tax=Vagococcus coleopterorum TaxID=2714946 RepID=A0A6G8ANW1_9ENTE|nr:chloramphenicol acetyltransferase [Vagococcus coleopterorum]QIL46632.1 chloramphenicol acetyltransferase [Vagococcus coleopterorum]
MKVIDQELWARKEHFKVLSGRDVPFYCITADVDVTNLKEYCKNQNISFYYALVYLATDALNNTENFRYKIQGDNVILYDELIPSFTDLEPGSDLYKGVTLKKVGDIKEFCHAASVESNQQTEYFPNIPFPLDQLIHFSMVPWINFTGFKNQFYIDKDDSIPKVTFGKYINKEGRLQMPLNIEVNHRLVDGIHLGKFFNDLQMRIADLS